MVSRSAPKRRSVRKVDGHGAVTDVTLDAHARNGEGCLCVAGSRANCTAACPKAMRNVLSNQVGFLQPAALAVSPDGAVHVADNGALLLVRMETVWPRAKEDGGDVSVADAVAR